MCACTAFQPCSHASLLPACLQPSSSTPPHLHTHPHSQHCLAFFSLHISRTFFFFSVSHGLCMAVVQWMALLYMCVCACCSAALHVWSCCHHVTVPLHACLSACSMLSVPALHHCMHACSMTSYLHAACTHFCFHACSVCLHCLPAVLSCFTAACMPSAIKLHTSTPPHPPTLLFCILPP